MIISGEGWPSEGHPNDVMRFWLLLFVLLPLTAGLYEHGIHCQELSCLPKEQLIDYLQSAIKEKDRLLAAFSQTSKPPSFWDEFDGENSTETCNICGRQPCLNGGKCQADIDSPWDKYTCICPGNTQGDHCETPLSCKNDTCGPGANCYVSNHQINCVCPMGYSGNPRDLQQGCSFHTKQACASGDPHYTTFDGLLFDYMGTCPYIYSEPCQPLAGGYDTYSVRSKSELCGNSHVAVATEVEVTMFGQIIHLDAKLKAAFFNGVKVNPTFNYPNNAQPIITVSYVNELFTVTSSQHVTVTFSTGGIICVSVPDVPEFRGPHTLCGLAGNIDDDPRNDVVWRNGSVLPLPANFTRLPIQDDPVESLLFNECQDSWQTNKFTATSATGQCILGAIITNNTACDLQKAADACSPIQQAANGSGPLGMCQRIGSNEIETYYENCVMDLCGGPGLRCSVLTNFVKICQTELPNTDVGPWRTVVDCIATCNQGSHYSSCTTSCPATCAEPKKPDTCNQGCECDKNNVIDNTNLLHFSCIPIADCGCMDPNGNFHQANKPWLDANCTISATCVNGTYSSQPTQCDQYGYCGTDSDHHMKCLCRPGFQGDGFNCTDINECLDPNSCGQDKGLGNCTNTLGSYKCSCKPYQLGKDCQQYKPSRHCADLQTYWGVRTDGEQIIHPPYSIQGQPAYSAVNVSCDMTHNGGGWTLMAHNGGVGMANRTFAEYEVGFGLGTDRWLGLDFIFKMTHDQQTSLLLKGIVRCGYGFVADDVTDCTYPLFSVNDATTGYAVVIPQMCNGTDKKYTGPFDGWVRWDLSGPGPAFQAFDKDTTIAKCTAIHSKVGFWFPDTQKDLCGPANLNGFRTSCLDPPPNQQNLRPFITYGYQLVADVWMYLRPADYTPPPPPPTQAPTQPPPAPSTVAPVPVETQPPPPPPPPATVAPTAAPPPPPPTPATAAPPPPPPPPATQPPPPRV